MRHDSVMLETPCEFINIVPLNPLISKCQIKVCYVGDEPNRNRSIITKDVARQMANTLPGSPIVGYYNEELEDFEEHSKDIHISNGKLVIKECTKPYGFVDLGAKCWFQKFLDDGKDEREYLMTEGYLWTGQYPEAQRIISEGNNQSMELDQKLIDAQWTKDKNGKPQFFIINEAVISKLCILGEEAEPCFEGSNITGVQFSLGDGFIDNMRSMMEELKELLNKEKGGAQMFTTYAVKVGDSLWNALYTHVSDKYSIFAVREEEGQKYAILRSKEDESFSRLNFSYSEDEGTFAPDEITAVEFSADEECQFAVEEVESFEAEFKKEDKKEEEDSEEKEEDGEDSSEKEEKPSEDDKKSDDEEDKDDEDKKKKNNYSLEEIPEYVELSTKYSDLESNYNTLKEEKEVLESQLQSLQQFKLEVERKAKEDMINNTFYMLSEEDKKDVVENIDTYSLDDIEAKLSIICVRNKVNFSAFDEEDDDDKKIPGTYNLGDNLYQEDSSIPAWIKAVMDTEKTLN